VAKNVRRGSRGVRDGYMVSRSDYRALYSVSKDKISDIEEKCRKTGKITSDVNIREKVGSQEYIQYGRFFRKGRKLPYIQI
jgi:hypothetical protein